MCVSCAIEYVLSMFEYVLSMFENAIEYVWVCYYVLSWNKRSMWQTALDLYTGFCAGYFSCVEYAIFFHEMVKNWHGSCVPCVDL